MKAMVLKSPGQPLVEERRHDPIPGPGELRIRIEAYAVCRTDLHIVDGELPDLRCPRVPGHEIVGRLDLVGPGTSDPILGRRVGLGWPGRTRGHRRYWGSEERPPEPLDAAPIFAPVGARAARLERGGRGRASRLRWHPHE